MMIIHHAPRASHHVNLLLWHHWGLIPHVILHQDPPTMTMTVMLEDDLPMTPQEAILHQEGGVEVEVPHVTGTSWPIHWNNADIPVPLSAHIFTPGWIAASQGLFTITTQISRI